MFDGIAEHENAEREVAERDFFCLFVCFVFFVTKLLIFLFVSF